jgi:hypothetical protein
MLRVVPGSIPGETHVLLLSAATAFVARRYRNFGGCEFLQVEICVRGPTLWSGKLGLGMRLGMMRGCDRFVANTWGHHHEVINTIILSIRPHHLVVKFSSLLLP